MAALEVTTRALNMAQPQSNSIDKALQEELDGLLKDLAG